MHFDYDLCVSEDSQTSVADVPDSDTRSVTKHTNIPDKISNQQQCWNPIQINIYACASTQGYKNCYK